MSVESKKQKNPKKPSNKKSSNKNITFDISYNYNGFSDEKNAQEALYKTEDPVEFRKKNVGFLQSEKGATAYWSLNGKYRKIKKLHLPRVFSDIGLNLVTENPTGLIGGTAHFDYRLGTLEQNKKKSKSRGKQEAVPPPFQGDFPKSMWASIEKSCQSKMVDLINNSEDTKIDAGIGMTTVQGLLALAGKLCQFSPEMGFFEKEIQANGTKRTAPEIAPIVTKKPKKSEKHEPNVEVTKHELTYYEGKNSGVIPELEDYIANCSYAMDGETWGSLDCERMMIKEGFAEELNNHEESPQFHEFCETQATIAAANTIEKVSKLDKNLLRFLHAICEIIYVKPEDRPDDKLVCFTNPKCTKDRPINYTVFKGSDLEIKGMMARNYEPRKPISAIMMNKGKTFRAFLYQFVKMGDVPEEDMIIAKSLTEDDTHEEIQKYAIPILAFFDFLFPEFTVPDSKVLKTEFMKFKTKNY